MRPNAPRNFTRSTIDTTVGTSHHRRIYLRSTLYKFYQVYGYWQAHAFVKPFVQRDICMYIQVYWYIYFLFKKLSFIHTRINSILLYLPRAVKSPTLRYYLLPVEIQQSKGVTVFILPWIVVITLFVTDGLRVRCRSFDSCFFWPSHHKLYRVKTCLFTPSSRRELLFAIPTYCRG